MTTETAYTLPLRFFFCSFSVGPVASGNARDFFGTSQTFHVLPYLDGCTLRVNHFLRKLFTWCSKRAFLIRDQVKRWSGKSKCVLWNPSCYDLRLFRTGEHSSRESKQKRNTIRTSFLLEAAAVSRFFNQPAVRNYIASALWLAEQNSREFLSQSKKTSKPVVICWPELSRAWGRLHASKYDWFTWLWARAVIGQSYYIGFRLRHFTLSMFRRI